MAIALDATSVSTNITTSGANAWNHTVTGTNTLLVVGMTTTSTVSQPTTTAVTYNGVSMTLARSDQTTQGASIFETSVWLLHNPSTGTNVISASITLGTGGNSIGRAASYTGAQQSSTADSANGKVGSATGAQNFNTVTVADNCWVYCTGINQAATGPTITATNTDRGSTAMNNVTANRMRHEDTNGAIHPAGALSTGFTIGGTGVVGWCMTGISFAPVATTSIKTIDSLAIASVKTVNGLATASVKTFNGLV